MPKTSANVPESQPSLDRLSLVAESIRGSGPSGASILCVACICFEAEAQGTPGIGGPMCICMDCEPAVMGALCPFCFEGDAE